MVERIRALLAETQLVSSTPAFTASYGIADSTTAARFAQLIRIADDGPCRATDGGRDRAVVGHPSNVEPRVLRHAVERPAAVDVGRLASGGD